jgi:hypothetical protein
MALLLVEFILHPSSPSLFVITSPPTPANALFQRPKEEKKEEERKRIRPPGLGGRFGAAEMVVFLFVYLFLSPSLSGYHGYQ